MSAMNLNAAKIVKKEVKTPGAKRQYEMISEVRKAVSSMTTAHLPGQRLLIETTGEIRSFGRRPYEGPIRITLPQELFENDVDPMTGTPSTTFPNVFPYGDKFTSRIAQKVYRANWEKHSFGVIPGEAHFEGGTAVFNGKIIPTLGTPSLLFISDGMLTAFATQEGGLTCFKLGKSGIEGVVIPINYLVEQRMLDFSSPTSLYDDMTRSLNRYREALKKAET